MKYEEQSNYPQEIDPLLFFHDITISQQKDMVTYDDLVKKGNYQLANEFMDNSTMHGFVASLFNALENRVYALQKHITEDLPPANRAINTFTEPTELSNEKFHETIWTGGDDKTYVLENTIDYAPNPVVVENSRNWVDTEDVTITIEQQNIDEQTTLDVPDSFSENTVWFGGKVEVVENVVENTEEI